MSINFSIYLNKFYNLAKYKLYPICRSLTGKGTLDTLKIIKREFASFKICSIKSGKKVFDWKIPDEWNISEAYVLDEAKNKIIDFKRNNLHIVSYSVPKNIVLKKKFFFQHLHSIKNNPSAIPYLTSYYKKYWGFCISQNQKDRFNSQYKNNDKFKILIKSSLNPKGRLNYGELIIKGKSKQEILISTYICHPSMANNELSGPIVSMCLIKYFQSLKKLHKTLRFVFVPETIGSICYLKKNLKYLKRNVLGGYNITCVGDQKNYSYILSKYKNSPSDKALLEAYNKREIEAKEYSFLERGSDERQYNSPGVDLGITTVCRSKFQEYPEYHTSLDDFNLVTKRGVLGSFKLIKTAIEILDNKIFPKNVFLCEPFMQKRNMYQNLFQVKKNKEIKNNMNFLQYSDGKNSLEDISNLINLSYKETKIIYKKLKKKKLIN
jgi:aminopeptidase-like protein